MRTNGAKYKTAFYEELAAESKTVYEHLNQRWWGRVLICFCRCMRWIVYGKRKYPSHNSIETAITISGVLFSLVLCSIPILFYFLENTIILKFGIIPVLSLYIRLVILTSRRELRKIHPKDRHYFKARVIVLVTLLLLLIVVVVTEIAAIHYPKLRFFLLLVVVPLGVLAILLFAQCSFSRKPNLKTYCRYNQKIFYSFYKLSAGYMAFAAYIHHMGICRKYYPPVNHLVISAIIIAVFSTVGIFYESTIFACIEEEENRIKCREIQRYSSRAWKTIKIKLSRQ